MENVLVKLFEHNLWANDRVLAACAALSDAQLDAEPKSATRGTIRRTLEHLVNSQRGYLALLTLPVDKRPHGSVDYAGYRETARASGEGLLALAHDPAGTLARTVRTGDGWDIAAWVVMVQVINHATEHREQINSMLTALGFTPLDMDGWSFGEAEGAAKPVNR